MVVIEFFSYVYVCVFVFSLSPLSRYVAHFLRWSVCLYVDAESNDARDRTLVQNRRPPNKREMANTLTRLLLENKGREISGTAITTRLQ